MPLQDNPFFQSTFENMNIKIRIGRLLFDIQLGHWFAPHAITGTSKKHSHFAYEVHFIVAGSGALLLEQRVENMVTGTVHIIGPNIYHSIRANPLTRFYFQFTFTDTQQEDHYTPESEWREIQQSLANLDYSQFVYSDQLLRLIAQINDELKTPTLGYYSNIQSLFTQIIVAITRTIRPSAPNYALPHKQSEEKRTFIIDSFFQLFMKHATIEDLAAQLYVSTKQTNRILQKYYNTSFQQKLLETRIEVAKELLRSSDLTIQQTAEEVGYADKKTFCTLFAKRTGLTPAQFRAIQPSQATSTP
ncbi:MAG: helix-turn-helix domain-containing protein [Paenibacillaceae bacterium]|nr:helix-turn-helix domain-containing protein [Paenibacillaceae bacterium]